MKLNSTKDGALACSYDEPWCGPHPLCQAETARICGVPLSEIALPDLSRYTVTPPDADETMDLLFAWHVHHNILLEPLTEPIEVRQTYIRAQKPREEQALRLRLLQPVKTACLPQEVVQAGQAYVTAKPVYDNAQRMHTKARQRYLKAGQIDIEAKRIYDEARRTYVTTGVPFVETALTYNEAGQTYVTAGQTYDKARAIYAKAGRIYDEVRHTYGEARRAYHKAQGTYHETVQLYATSLEALHRMCCLQCPWDGTTIFPGKDVR